MASNVSVILEEDVEEDGDLKAISEFINKFKQDFTVNLYVKLWLVYILHIGEYSRDQREETVGIS